MKKSNHRLFQTSSNAIEKHTSATCNIVSHHGREKWNRGNDGQTSFSSIKPYNHFFHSQIYFYPRYDFTVLSFDCQHSGQMADLSKLNSSNQKTMSVIWNRSATRTTLKILSWKALEILFPCVLRNLCLESVHDCSEFCDQLHITLRTFHLAEYTDPFWPPVSSVSLPFSRDVYLPPGVLDFSLSVCIIYKKKKEFHDSSPEERGTRFARSREWN